jgi:hypothetical protein
MRVLFGEMRELARCASLEIVTAWWIGRRGEVDGFAEGSMGRIGKASQRYGGMYIDRLHREVCSVL